jgi:hypothetical protein
MDSMARCFELSHTPLRRWSVAGLASAAVAPALACQPSAGEPQFRIVSVEFDGDSTLTLTFSEAIANAAEIDPNDFRISFAQTLAGTYVPYDGTAEVDFELTAYQDLSIFDYGGGYYGGFERFGFVSAARGAAANQLVLESTTAAISPACEALDYIQTYTGQYHEEIGWTSDFGLFVHYAAREIPLEGESGRILADIGADWVLEDGSYLERDSYGFTNLIPQLRIPCP